MYHNTNESVEERFRTAAMAVGAQTIRQFIQFQALELRLALVSVSVLLLLLLMIPRHTLLPDWNLFASLNSDNTMEGDEFPVKLQYLEEVILSNRTNILCDFRSMRSNFCEIKNFIQIFGHASLINYHSSLSNGSMQKYRGFKLKPHPRKHDKVALAHVKEISIEPISLNQTPPRCSVIHIAPAIIFSTGGYIGNMFHDFTDVLIPLFITSFPFRGQVHFLVGEMQPWWINKYQPFLNQLTRYKVINLNRVKRALCYSHVIVGLKFHKEMSIDPKKTNNNYSMVDFGKVIRKSFGLERENATVLGLHNGKKPRLLIISRKKSRSFTNVKNIVKMAATLGYEVVVQEPSSRSKLRDFARIVNSCDVLMGVHGAGLTNMVFLPINAVVIQVVPLGGLEKLANEDFGIPAVDMNLKYLQYSINKEESTLMEKYPRDHVIFTDPSAIRRKGWAALRSAYLVNQNVKLDVSRFKGVLLEALNLLHE